MKILVTGCVGFIGSHVCERLLSNGYEVIGLDNQQNQRNLNLLIKFPNFTWRQEDILTSDVILSFKPSIVIHLASLTGVRDSLNQAEKYCDINIKGQIHLLDQAVKAGVSYFLYASSSSVYGENTKVPFDENDPTDHIVSPYALSKKCMEEFAHLYYRLYGLSVVGFRFFTVYGPRGRKDMAPDRFLRAIHNNEPIHLFGDGTALRDFTYIDDIVDGIMKCISSLKDSIDEIYNLGSESPISLSEFIKICERVVGKTANIIQEDSFKGDAPCTFSSTKKAHQDFGYKASWTIEEGLRKTYQAIKDHLS